MSSRPRRNRRSPAIRELFAESFLNANHLVYPVFVQEGSKTKVPLKALPGLYRWSPDSLVEHLKPWVLERGLSHVALFPSISAEKKNPTATEALNPKGLAPKVIQTLRKAFPELEIYTDIALDPFNSDGHDGIVRNGNILNDETVEILCKMAVLYAQAGAQWVCPSDMMDGRIGAIRKTLDRNQNKDTGIVSYCAKYASNLYGPFREALDSAPKAGDKKTYQMDFRNRKEALRELRLDLKEGADVVMVKPGIFYLDIVHLFQSISSVPVAVYQVSGEYAMLKIAGNAGAISYPQVLMESLFSFRRAGASMIWSYATLDALDLLH